MPRGAACSASATHVAIRRDRVADPARQAELAARIGLGAFPLVQEVPGFVTGYVVVGDEGAVSCLLFFSDRTRAEAALGALAAWIEEQVAALVDGAPEVALGEIRTTEIGTSR